MSVKRRPDDLPREADAVVVDHPDHCVACHSCELACSYHHLGLFQPGRSSVSIERDADSGVITRRRYHAAEEGRIACDLCAGEPEPLCERYCARPIVRRIVEDRPHAPAQSAPAAQVEGGRDADA